MSDIKWEDGAVCFAGNSQWNYIPDNIRIINFESFQLNEIRRGDYIEAPELDTEHSYNDAIEVFGLSGFNPYLHNGMTEREFIDLALEGGYGFFVDTDADLVIDHGHVDDIKQRRRKITYTQLMEIGKLKRAMIEKSAPKIAPDLTPDVEIKGDWSDEHYNHFYQLSEEDIKAGQIKVDAYFVNRMWKINSWEDTGAGFHILKTLPRIANNKNSLKRELVALKKQVDMLCKLHGVDDEELK